MREMEAATAGGVNVMLTSQTTSRICLLQALSPVGRCKSFDASGDGYGRGEAFSVVVLKPSPTTQPESGHRPAAIIRGSAVNQDGR